MRQIRFIAGVAIAAGLAACGNSASAPISSGDMQSKAPGICTATFDPATHQRYYACPVATSDACFENPSHANSGFRWICPAPNEVHQGP